MPKLFFKSIVSLMLLSSIESLAIQPSDVLRDEVNETTTESGLVVRKGTIYATILNIYQFNQLIKKPDSIQKEIAIENVIRDMQEVIPALEAVKMFELFSIEEWLNCPLDNEGRLAVGLLYLQAFPNAKYLNLVDNMKQNYEANSLTLQKIIDQTWFTLENL